ncbi:MAG TPA: outer membrane beta-barrel protein [Puia sp.]|nr:outer membrane beta-barrel protein [Puia sp.]
MKKMATAFIICLLLANSSFSQVKITGRVHSTEGVPLARASVLLLNPRDSTLIKGVVTDQSGVFGFDNILPGTYLISASYAGFDPVYLLPVEVSADKNLIDVGVISLSPTSELATVTVSAKKPLYEVKIDRMVINVATAINFTGISVLDVLQRSPGVVVNRINNSLAINGKDGVIIMINGKRNYMDMAAILEMLAAMPSGSIEKIEIITTPPAKFDAEGNAGIINIVLKTNDQFGTNGSYTLTTGYNTGSRNAVSMNINHRQGKINLYGNYSFSDAHLEQRWNIYHAVYNAGNFNENYSADDRHGNMLFNNIRAGLDYEVNNKTVVGVLFTGNYRKWTMTSNNNAQLLVNGVKDTALTILNTELHTTLYGGANLNFQHTFKHEEKITFNADYLYYSDKNPNSYLNNYNDAKGNFLYSENVRSSKNTPLRFVILAADFSKKMLKNTDMESGIKLTNSDMTNDISVSNFLQPNWIVDTSLSGIHMEKETIAAAYSTFTVKFSEKNSMKAGLRYEYTHTNLSSPSEPDLVNRKYGSFFPSFYFLHSFKEGSSINLTYSRRIYRPSFSDLAPWVIFLDPKTFQTGNPFLQPSFTDAVGLSYTLKNYIASLSYSYYSPSMINQPKLDSTTNKLVTSTQNSKNARYASLDLTLPFTLARWWNMQNTLSFNWREANAFYLSPVTTRGTGYYFNTVQSFILPKDFSVSISGYYNSASGWGLYTFKGVGSFDAGMQKKFGKKRSTLTFNVTNILNNDKTIMSAAIPSQNLLLTERFLYDRTGVSVSFTHNFGIDKVKGKRERATGDEDEKSRGY